MTRNAFSIDDLRQFPRNHETLVGVDSDGCVFDTMGVKQREHFHPLIIRHWHLEAIAPQVRAAAEFVNLNSVWRGRNRFSNLLLVFELLADRDDVAASGVPLPDLAPLRRYCSSGLALGNRTLEAEVRRTGDAELRRLLDWSLAINHDIDTAMRPVPPFAAARLSLEKMAGHSDLLVVSQTPEAALIKEWRQHRLDHLVAVIGGQELGSKAEHLRLASSGRYRAGRVLMIGDAPADLASAEKAGALFYPIMPGREEASWQQLLDEAYGLFLEGRYGGRYADERIKAFRDCLPVQPPWLRGETPLHTLPENTP